MTLIKAIAVRTAQSALLSCCLALPAFPQQANQLDKSSGPASGRSASQPNASADSQSKVIEHDGIYQVIGPIKPPKVIHAQTPKYSRAAKRARLEGDCILSLVVDANGKPQNIKVKKALGMGLDENAVKAIEKYRFKPATLNGKPVPVEVNIDVRFRIW